MSVFAAIVTDLVNDHVPHLVAAVPADSIFDRGTKMTNQTKTLLVGAAGIIAILVVFITTWKTKTLAGFLGSLALAALFVWGVNNVTSDTVQSPIEDTVDEKGAPAPAPGGGVSVPSLTTRS